MSKMSEMSFSFSLNVILSMSKIGQIHLRAVMLCMSKMEKEHTHTFLYRVCDMLEMSFSFSLNVMSKMLKIGQIHLRAVMLCMSKMLKIKKKHTYTFLFITSLIFNGFSIQKSFGKLRLRAFKIYYQILCMSKHVEDVEDYL